MVKWFLPLFALSALTASASAQTASEPTATTSSPPPILTPRPADMEDKASQARQAQDRLNRKVSQTAKRAISSMCEECLGPRYNRPGPKTPLIFV